MTFYKTQIVNIDVEGEIERVQSMNEFSQEQKERLCKLYDWFKLGKFKECIEFIGTWGRDPVLGCSETEFIMDEVYTILDEVKIFGKDISVTTSSS